MLVMRGASLTAVGRMLGHRTASMTDRYVHLSEQFEAATVGLLDKPLDFEREQKP